MASAITKWGANQFLDSFFGRRTPPPSTLFVALLTSAPGEYTDGSLLAEPDISAGYVRAEIDNSTFAWGAAANGTTTHIQSVLFPTALSDWPVITHYALCDALVDGNVYLYASFHTPRKVTAGNTPRIAAGVLTLSVSSLSSALVSTF